MEPDSECQTFLSPRHLDSFWSLPVPQYCSACKFYPAPCTVTACSTRAWVMHLYCWCRATRVDATIRHHSDYLVLRDTFFGVGTLFCAHWETTILRTCYSPLRYDPVGLGWDHTVLRSVYLPVVLLLPCYFLWDILPPTFSATVYCSCHHPFPRAVTVATHTLTWMTATVMLPAFYITSPLPCVTMGWSSCLPLILYAYSTLLTYHHCCSGLLFFSPTPLFHCVISATVAPVPCLPTTCHLLVPACVSSRWYHLFMYHWRPPVYYLHLP
jgi:hypothetical protein